MSLLVGILWGGIVTAPIGGGQFISLIDKMLH